MKKIVAVLILMILCLPGKTQTDNSRKMALGFIAAPTLNWMSTHDDNIENAGTIIGFKFGLNSDFFFSPNYAFSTGLFLHKTGGKLKYLDEPALIDLGGEEVIFQNEELRYDISYLEVPLSLRLQTDDFNRFVYTGRFGFTPMLRTRAESGDGNNLKEEISFFNLNYHIGAGFEYFISGNTGLTFNVVYTDGIMDITKDKLGKSDHTTLNGVEFIVGINF